MQEEHQTNYGYKNMSGEREVMEDSIKESGQDMHNRLLKKIREEGESRSVYELGNPAMIAGTFDYLRLESLINDLLGKAAGINHNFGVLIKLLTMQLLNVPHQSLSDTSWFMESIPGEVILGKEVKPEQAYRSNIANLLDVIGSLGTEKLFISLSRQVFDRLGIEPQQAQIESAGFYYSGYVSEDDSCQLILNQRYGRENPELNHASNLVLVDSIGRIPIGIINGADSASRTSSAFDKASSCLPELRKKFPNLQSVSRRQLPARGCWRCCTGPEMTVDCMYLKDSSRIEVLLFLMDTALLVYAATEYLARKVMKEKNLSLTGPERRVNSRPTGNFLLSCISFLDTSLVLDRYTGEWSVVNINREFASILIALGHEWMKYFVDTSYTCMKRKGQS